MKLPKCLTDRRYSVEKYIIKCIYKNKIQDIKTIFKHKKFSSDEIKNWIYYSLFYEHYNITLFLLSSLPEKINMTSLVELYK
jgi:hypothetical protein